MSSNKSLSEAALEYVGVKFIHRGRTRRGVDCVGLVILAAQDCGYLAEDLPAYGREPRNGLLEKTLADHLGAPVNRAPAVNDVVVMSLQSGQQPSHVGIITHHPNGLGIVHAYGEIGRVAHQRLDTNKIKRIAEVYEWPAKY